MVIDENVLLFGRSISLLWQAIPFKLTSKRQQIRDFFSNQKKSTNRIYA